MKNEGMNEITIELGKVNANFGLEAQTTWNSELGIVLIHRIMLRLCFIP